MSLEAVLGKCGAPSIGIVVPVYNEAAILAGALGRLRAVLEGEAVIVVDGGSTDGSAEIARRFFPAEILRPANRGAQLNHGGRRLTAEILLFLHADTALPPGFASAVRRALVDPGVCGGCFQLRFDLERPMLRFYEWCTQFPGRFLHFGDQAFFVRRETFWRMGGFRAWAFLEDVEFLRRLRRKGRFVVLPETVTTSARRFRKRGAVRQMLWNVSLVTLFELGARPERLARFYPNVR